MKLFSTLVIAVFCSGYLSQVCVNSTLSANKPSVVKIGCILTFNSDVGRVSKAALEAAVEDVNSNPDVLRGTKLNITVLDSNSSGLIGIVEAIRFMETETVAIIGPQSSVIAHVISHVANELKVPLLSFAASDPNLASLQYPFFIRTSHNDLHQMAAIASLIEQYEWREVIAIYVDDDYGRNGISALADQLAIKRCRISYRAPLRLDPTIDDVRDLLVQVALRESRILVVHTYSPEGMTIFSLAKSLGMMESGYVWIATCWLSTFLDTNAPLISSDVTDDIEGVITFRVYTPNSEAKRSFIARWRDLSSLGLCASGLYAYDTVWLLARALDAFFERGGNVSFSPVVKSSYWMNVFDGGDLLLDGIMKMKITGVTGLLEFNHERELDHPAFEVINVVGTGIRKVGYWSNHSGLSIVPPDYLDSSHRKLYPVIFAGQTTEKPRGWVFPNSGRVLRIGVPNRASFLEFVGRVEGTDMFKGYCIEVFKAALNHLSYAVPYKFEPFGNGHSNPENSELLRLINQGEYDAAVGDVSITTERTKMVDFTQPFIESGLVVVAPVTERGSNAWAFLRPFSPMVWGVTGLFFLVVGTVVWTLEHRINDDFRGPPRKQIETIFCFSTLFFAHREETVSALGRSVVAIWLFVVLIITSSYSASLTSILTVHHLSSPIGGIESLLTTNDPIGYQIGSFARNYLIKELGIHESRLVPLNVPEDYAKALRDGPGKGGVAAVVDERAYIELFLSTRCDFSILGQEFTRTGWGFAFPKDSPLAIDISTAILKLTENGEMQRIHDKWLLRSACMSESTELEVNYLQLKRFSGLFLVSGSACCLAVLIYFVQLTCKFKRYHSEPEPEPEPEPSSSGCSGSSRLQTFLSFVDEKEKSVKIRSKGTDENVQQ